MAWCTALELLPREWLLSPRFSPVDLWWLGALWLLWPLARPLFALCWFEEMRIFFIWCPPEVVVTICT